MGFESFNWIGHEAYAAAALQARAEHALRFANEKVWDETKGDNLLGTIEVSESAPGVAGTAAADFVVLSE